MRRRLTALLTIIVMAALTGVSWTAASTAQAAACTQIYHQGKYDPEYKKTWTTSWDCGNDTGVSLYYEPNRGSVSAYQDGAHALFVCWKRGAFHAGGNDVWYYTRGDRAKSGSTTDRWGYMPAKNVHTPDGSDPWPDMAKCPYPAKPATPTRSNGTGKPVLFLHGYDFWHSVVCSDYWGDRQNDAVFKSMGWTSSQIINLTYYDDGGSACLRFSNSGNGTLIEKIGHDFAWYVYNNYSSKGKVVDVVAHSMGGLVARVAIAGTRQDRTVQGMPFPPYLFIEDVATLSTPHEGIRDNIKSVCQNVSTGQCLQMYPGSDFYRSWIDRAYYENPQSDMGTDWSAIGSGDDWTVSSGSGLNKNAVTHFGHKYLYLSGSGIDHEMIHKIGTNGGRTYDVPFCDAGAGCDMSDWSNWSTYGSGQGPLWFAAMAVKEKSW